MGANMSHELEVSRGALTQGAREIGRAAIERTTSLRFAHGAQGSAHVPGGPTRHVMSGCCWSLPAAWDVIEGSQAVSEVSSGWWPWQHIARSWGSYLSELWGLVVHVAESRDWAWLGQIGGYQGDWRAYRV